MYCCHEIGPVLSPLLFQRAHIFLFLGGDASNLPILLLLFLFLLHAFLSTALILVMCPLGAGVGLFVQETTSASLESSATPFVCPVVVSFSLTVIMLQRRK